MVVNACVTHTKGYCVPVRKRYSAAEYRLRSVRMQMEYVSEGEYFTATCYGFSLLYFVTPVVVAKKKRPRREKCRIEEIVELPALTQVTVKQLFNVYL